VVRVPVLEPGRELVVKKLALDCATEPAIRKTFGAPARAAGPFS
jgi:hypothetical protein